MDCLMAFFVAVCCTTLARVASLPCSPGLVSLVVEDSAGASALANATNCTGGEFDVEWIGYVEFPGTIFVVAGTVLNITGADVGAVADGQYTNQFLNVAGATVHMSGMRVEHCAADFGGAVFANASRLTFNATTFVGNAATEEGGALYVDDSNVSWSRETNLSANTASGEHGRGGAISADRSSVYWSGETIFSGNVAAGAGENGTGGGGAIFARSSSAYWSGETSFSGNTANSTGVGSVSGGGALSAIESRVSWDGETSFSGNTAEGENTFGGALFVLESSVHWSGATSFSGNLAGNFAWFDGSGLSAMAGALYISQSNASWSVETSFSDNVAAADEVVAGGAIRATIGSIVSWSGETTFSNNGVTCFVNETCGEGSGGALAVHFSDVSWSGETTFSENFALGVVGIGGAFSASDSTVNWSAETSFFNNTASGHWSGYGGALSVYNSDLSWSGETGYWDNTGSLGAALLLVGSSVSWNAETILAGNLGPNTGVLQVEESSVSWSAATTFSNNTGGALLVIQESSASWSGETSFSNNSAWSGGAIEVKGGSNVSWSGETSFTNNFASSVHGGGAIEAAESSVSWTGETTFSDNSALQSGGALTARNGSDVSWSARTWFSGNAAFGEYLGGGALCAEGGSIVSWSGETIFSGNTASTAGGALYVDSSTVSWNEVTSFSNNSAGLVISSTSTADGSSDGGAVYVTGSVEVVNEPVPSHVSWFAGTKFLDNACTGSGGALALVGEGYLYAQAVVFEGNTAETSGGAVFVSAVGSGPVFVNSSFTANISPQGGAAYSVSSGTASEGGNRYPTTYEECFFTGNEASRTGGAVESVAGYDNFVNSTFQGNSAGAGGALRLGGSTYLTNCGFVDNASDEDGGAAISNVGALFLSGATMFAGNDFWCEDGTYLDSADGDRLSKVCDGCDECFGCEVEEANSMPICSSQLEQTRSGGGDTTIETLEVNAGYWRATSTSPDVLACYNEDACLGGLTGSQGYCQEGYEGPYCSVCSEDYTTTLSFTCVGCVDSRGGIAIMTAVALLSLFAIIALFVHLVSGEKDGARQGIVHRVTKRLPLQSIKIIVVVWQILTQFTSVANVTYPDVYQRFLDGVNVLNFDALWIPSAGCIMDVDFHDRLLVSTIGPLVALALLAATFVVAKHRNRGSETALERVRHRHMSMVLLISFLVYSSVSATVFQTFACEHLDDGKNYLRADYRIECDSSKHQAFEFFAYAMVAVYPVGIPLFYAYLLYKNRRVLASEGDEVTRTTSSQVQPISDLWVPYKPGRFYYEVIECMRRIMLTGVVVFIYPNTAAQVAVTLMIAFLFVVMSLLLAPYVSKWDASISLAGHVIVFTSMYTALLSKVDVSDERDVNQEVFAGILVAAHACMVVAVAVETAVIFCSMGRRGGPRQREGLRPRVHCTPVVHFPKDSCLSS